MPAVKTVKGPMDVEALGRTLVHEHFRAADEGPPSGATRPRSPCWSAGHADRISSLRTPAPRSTGYRPRSWTT